LYELSVNTYIKGSRLA